MDHDDLDEDIQRLNVVLQDEEDEEEGDSEGELRVLENDEEEYYSNASRPSTSSDVTASSQPTTSICTDADESLFRFDPHTITPEACLAMNRAYQEVLLDTLRQIEMSLIENRQRQKELEERVDERNKKTDKQSKEDIILQESKHVPYFRDKNGDVPPCNEDVRLKAHMNEEKQHVLPKLGWTKVQRKGLLDAIKLDALEQIIRPLLNRQELEMEKLQKCKNREEIEEVKRRIEELQKEIKLKQLTPADELLKNVDSQKIDFMKISNFSFNRKFSTAECESMWKNVLRPGINRDRWTAEEEEVLKQLAVKYQMRNWKQIAEELGTNRTAFQCLQHYQQNNIVYDNSEWTEEEDELLKEVVETCTYGLSKVHWHQVAYYIDRRSAKQCQSRWMKINPKRILGRWTKEEDMQLLNAIHAQGGVLYWPKIQELVPTRNASQCRERYVKRMAGFDLNKPWTYEGDKQLLILHQQYGGQWSRIAEHLVKRNDHMIAARYKCLMKWQSLMDDFYQQPRKLQKQLKHPSFRFGQKGMLIPKSGLNLRLGRGRGRPKKIFKDKKASDKTELRRLKETGGKHAAEAFEDIEMDEEPEEEIAEEEKTEEEVEEERVPNKTLQDKLDFFLCRYNVKAEDYLKQMQDKLDGGMVVPRPPPMNKTHTVQTVWKKHNNLVDVVQTQIDLYLNELQTKEETGEGETVNKQGLYEQIAGHIKIDDETEKRKMIMSAFGGKNPASLSVRELLNISRCIKECGKPPKNAKTYHQEPWEEDETDEDNEEEESTSEEEEEEEVTEEPKPKRPRSEKQIAHQATLGENLKKYYEIERQIQKVVHVKMDPSELYKGRGRRKQFLMYPRNILQKYKGLEEERKLNRKSLVLLMKTLDVDAKSAYMKARRGKQKISAMAFLKAAERANLKRAKTRRQKTEIQEAAQVEANINSEISEASEFLLDLQEELKITDEDEDNEDSQDKDGPVCFGYNKSLPYIPPNRSNLGGMRSLLIEHRCLIDQAGFYFNPQMLKQQLYDLKQKGPNQLMGVLNAIGKTESVRKKINVKQGKQWLHPEECQEQLEEVRKTTAYQQLKARFQSIFTWPALVSTIRPPKGAPLPKVLQEVLDEPQPSTSNTGADDVGNDGVESDQPSVILEHLSGNTAAGLNMEAGAKEVATQSVDDADDDDDEDLPEEEAVEKLVDKIMAEYERERMKKKRFLPTKKYRKFSEKKKQAFVEKERTKILKRLGLYEKMQEFKRRRLEAEQSVAMSLAAASSTGTNTGQTVTIAAANSTGTNTGQTETAEAANSTGTNTGQTEIGSLDAKSSPKGTIGISTVTTETQGSVMISSEGCQTDLDVEDIGTPEVIVNTEKEPPKKRRGRPVGAKTKCYANKSPERKSQRTTEGQVMKTEQDYEMSPPKKKINRNRKGVQYNMVRNLIPEKMSKIAAQIPDLPILNEPVQEKEKKEKPARIPKDEKPKTERKRVVKSKFGNAKGRNQTRGPKTGRIFKQFQEAEGRVLTAEIKTETVQFKSEPVSLDEMGDEASGVPNDTGLHYNVVVTDSVYTEMEQIPDETVTSRAKENNEGVKEKMTATISSLSNTRSDENQEQRGNSIAQNDINGCEGSRIHSSNASSGEDMTTGDSVSKPENNKIQDNSQTDKHQLFDGIEGRKPFLVAVPVMIGDTQQVAMIPFYPDQDGKITLPNGKKIDTTESQGAGSVSLPVINFDQPVQVIDPGKQNLQN